MVGLPDVVRTLEVAYGPQVDRSLTDPFELVLWETVAYLASDERRAEAFAELRERVGTTPQDILRATAEDLERAGAFGILPAESARKMRRAAELAVNDFGGDLRSVISLPPAKARRALQRFPGIGEPGAEKILLHSGSHGSLAPDSNALRVLVRLGLCEEGPRYAVTYRSAREVAQSQLGDDIETLMSARYLLRRHGQLVCRTKRPLCAECVLRTVCPSATPLKEPGP